MICGAFSGFGKYSRNSVRDVEENCRRNGCCRIDTQLRLKPWVVAVEDECVKLATDRESSVAVCFVRGNFAGSLVVAIDESRARGRK